MPGIWGLGAEWLCLGSCWGRGGRCGGVARVFGVGRSRAGAIWGEVCRMSGVGWEGDRAGDGFFEGAVAATSG
jgi:hypothetical protein